MPPFIAIPATDAPGTLRMRVPEQPPSSQTPPPPPIEFKAELEQLRIEIDEVRKEREVREILESDFFRQVQERAAELRRSDE